MSPGDRDRDDLKEVHGEYRVFGEYYHLPLPFVSSVDFHPRAQRRSWRH